jgi:hypothetical protein
MYGSFSEKIACVNKPLQLCLEESRYEGRIGGKPPILHGTVTTQVLFACHPGENRDPSAFSWWIPASAGMTIMRNPQGSE